MLLWAIIFIVSTTIILIFKKDKSLTVVADVSELRLGVEESYKHLWHVLKIRPIQMVCLLLLTCRVSYPLYQSKKNRNRNTAYLRLIVGRLWSCFWCGTSQTCSHWSACRSAGTLSYSAVTIPSGPTFYTQPKDDWTSINALFYGYPRVQVSFLLNLYTHFVRIVG